MRCTLRSLVWSGWSIPKVTMGASLAEGPRRARPLRQAKVPNPPVEEQRPDAGTADQLPGSPAPVFLVGPGGQ